MGSATIQRLRSRGPEHDISYPDSLAASKKSRRDPRGRGSEPLVPRSLETPAALVNQPVMRSAEHREVAERRLAASRPPDEVMSVAPGQWPPAAGPDTVAGARFECPTYRSRERPGCVIRAGVD